MSKLIEIKKDKKVLHVTEKAFKVVYAGLGYKHIGDVEADQENKQTDIDLFELDKSELKKINKDDIKAFLDKEEIEYDSNATKDDLINFVLGE